MKSILELVVVASLTACGAKPEADLADHRISSAAADAEFLAWQRDVQEKLSKSIDEAEDPQKRLAIAMERLARDLEELRRYPIVAITIPASQARYVVPTSDNFGIHPVAVSETKELRELTPFENDYIEKTPGCLTEAYLGSDGVLRPDYCRAPQLEAAK